MNIQLVEPRLLRPDGPRADPLADIDIEQACVGIFARAWQDGAKDTLDIMMVLQGDDFAHDATRVVFSVIRKEAAEGKSFGGKLTYKILFGPEILPGTNETGAQYALRCVLSASYIGPVADLVSKVRRDAIARRCWAISAEMESGARPAEQAIALLGEALERHRQNDVGDAGLLSFAGEATLDDVSDQLVDGLLSSASIAALFAVSTAGKTFVALALAYAIAHGRDFLGRRCLPGAVLFCALEGKGGWPQRLVAANRVYGDPGKRVATLNVPISLGPDPATAEAISNIIAGVKRLAKVAGAPVRMVVIDTLAVALAGQEENGNAVLSAVLAQCQRIVAETGATVMLVHHPGKADAKSMRGASALFAGCDEVLRIDREDGSTVRDLVIQKSKDGDEGPVASFTLEKVQLGTNNKGRTITSCVLKELTTPRGPKKPERPKPHTASGKALNELEHLIIDGRFSTSRGHDRIKDGTKLVSIEHWREACSRVMLSEEGSEETEKRTFRRTKSDLSARGLIASFDGKVWMPGHFSEPGQNGENTQRF
ncbi:regulatory protein [Hyphomicrobium sp. 1Nfss2.1]|uniref:AAA family ATPase n=1 Tax=Hyphomicrobium sp. 1Nfss2.1 TaxID=3413936 RepID=UPI003C7D9D3E